MEKHLPPLHSQIQCMVTGLEALQQSIKDLDGVMEGWRAATQELPEEGIMCMQCVEKAWEDVLARDDLVPAGVRESIQAAQLSVLSTSPGGASIRALLSPADAVRVMIHSHLLDDLELALSCELQMTVSLVVSFS